jgi:hypothetical protein
VFAPAPRFPRSARIVGFCALVVGLAVALHVAIGHGLRRIPTAKFGSLNRIVDGRVNAEIVVSGSSRAMFHYDPRIIAGVTGRTVYNIGQVAARTDLQIALLKTYLSHNTKPRLIVHNLDPYSLVTTKRGEIYDAGSFIPYLGEAPLFAAIRRIEPDAWKWRYLPLYGYAVEDLRFIWSLGLAAYVGKFERENTFDGFFPRFETWTDDFAKFKASVGEGTTYTIEPAAVTLLGELVELCRERGIALVLVFSPEYFEAQRLLLNRGEIMGVFRRLSAGGVPFWDYSDSNLSRRQDYFYSSQHLNATGAAAFSTDLARRIATLELDRPAR